VHVCNIGIRYHKVNIYILICARECVYTTTILYYCTLYIDTRFGKVCKAAVKRQTTLGNIYSSIRLDKQLGGEVYILWD